MLRTFQIALFSVTMMVTACKKADKPAGTTSEQVAKPGDPSKPGDPTKPADPAAKPGDPAAAPAGGNTELEAKGIAMMKRMADMFAADAQDCEKMANDIKAFTLQNKDLLKQLNTMEKNQTEQEKKAFEVRNKSVQDELLQKVTPAMTACEENKNVEAAMKALEPE